MMFQNNSKKIKKKGFPKSEKLFFYFHKTLVFRNLQMRTNRNPIPHIDGNYRHDDAFYLLFIKKLGCLFVSFVGKTFLADKRDFFGHCEDRFLFVGK